MMKGGVGRNMMKSVTHYLRAEQATSLFLLTAVWSVVEVRGWFTPELPPSVVSAAARLGRSHGGGGRGRGPLKVGAGLGLVVDERCGRRALKGDLRTGGVRQV